MLRQPRFQFVRYFQTIHRLPFKLISHEANQIAPETDQIKRFPIERPALPSVARYRIVNVAYGTYMMLTGGFIELSNMHIEEELNRLVSTFLSRLFFEILF